MAGKAGFRIQDSGFRNDGLAGGQMGRWADGEKHFPSCLPAYLAVCLFVFLCSSLVTRHSSLLLAQQPQAQGGQPLSALNAKFVNGVAPGYWPTAGSGLTLNLTQGTAMCGYPPAPVTYSGGTLTLAAAATNYVYLDPLGSCAPALNTSGFGVGQIPVAVVATNASGITSLNDLRSWFAPSLSMDSTGRSILKGINGAYFADQFGDKSTTGIASSISACGGSAACRVLVPGSYPTTEAVPGSFSAGALSTYNAGTTSANTQVFDYRQGDREAAFNQNGGGANNRAWHEWVESLSNPVGATQQTHSLFSPVIQNMDGGSLVSNPTYTNKSGFRVIDAYGMDHTPSSSVVGQFSMYKYSPGDSIPLFAYDQFYGGMSTQGEEGAEAADLWLMQGNTAYQATCTSGCTTGSTSLTLTPTAGSGTQAAGRYLIDANPADTITAGTISAITNNAGAPVTMTGSGTSWPVSTVNTTSTQAVTAPGAQTITLSSVSGITANSTVLVFADASAYETVIPTAVGAGSITATFTAPHASGAIVCAGGLAGYFLELTADTVPSGTSGGTALRQPWPVLCSSSATSISVYVDQQGTFSSLTSGSSTQWANTGGQNGYALYPGAQVTSVYANGAVGNTFTLMANTVPWATSDAVEEPQHPANGSRLGTWDLQSWWPFSGQWGPDLTFLGVQGPGTKGILFNNFSPVAPYQAGTLGIPTCMICAQGPWTNLLSASSPQNSMTGFNIGKPGTGWTGTQQFNVATIYPASGSPDYLEYLAGSWIISTGNQSGQSFTIGPNGTSGSTPCAEGMVQQPASDSLTNSTTNAQAFATKCTIPANYFTAGKTIQIEAAFQVTTTVATVPTVNMQMELSSSVGAGGTKVYNGTAITPHASMSSAPSTKLFYVSGKTTPGASVGLNGDMVSGPDTAGYNGSIFGQGQPAGWTGPTNGTLYLQFEVAFGATTTAVTLTLVELTVYSIN